MLKEPEAMTFLFMISTILLASLFLTPITGKSVSIRLENTNTASAEPDQPVRGKLYDALELRLKTVGGLSPVSNNHRKTFPTMQSKRTCKYNLGLSHDCDYRDAASAALRRKYAKSGLSPGKRSQIPAKNSHRMNL